MTKLTDLTQKISELWTDTTDSAVQSIDRVTNYSSDRLNELTEKAKTSLEASLNQADNFSGYAIDSLQTKLNSVINNWLAHHPLIFWLYKHPIITLISAFIIGVILWRLLAAIAFVITTTIDRVWLWVFHSPILFWQSFFGKKEELPPAENKLEITINSRQFEQIIERLDRIQAEQRAIVQEINNLKQTHNLDKSNLLIINKTQNSEINS
ncbi:MAG: hypothetical protein AB4368_00170 [Xenococcaceae cyanobacterium]